jgi:cell division protein FtsB
VIRRAVRRRAGVAVATLALIGVLSLAVFPTRAFLQQRRHREDLTTQVAELAATNEALRQRAAVLDSTAEIERLARLHYHLIRPGEEAYVILPDNTPPTTTPPPAPAVPAVAEQGWWTRMWDRVSSIF